MSIRIRVYPNGGAGAYGAMGAYGGVNGYGGAVSAQTFFNQKLNAQRQVSQLQLTYERALWGERLERTRLEERMKNPYAAMQTAGLGAYGLAAPALGVAGLGVPGMGLGYGGYGMAQAYNPLASMFGGLGLNRFF